jgi:NitT/TauT family transport system substrate-binding protein
MVSTKTVPSAGSKISGEIARFTEKNCKRFQFAKQETGMQSQNRRTFLKAASAQGLALGVGSAGLWLPQSALAQAPELKWADLTPGFTILISEYMQAKGIAKKHGLNLGKPTTYASVSTYYNDFVAGNFDVCIGSWDTFAARYLAGVPLQFVCAITTANMINIVVPKGGATSIKQLEGKLLAAPQSTGTYRMTRAVVKELEGIDIETAMKVQNVDNPAASVTLVMANRADAGLSWEPNISAGIKKVADLRVLYNVGEEYKKKMHLDLPFFGVAVRKEAVARDPSIVAKLNAAFADCLAGITGNVNEAVSIVGARTGIRKASSFLIRNQMLPKEVDRNFFAS